MRLAEQLTIGAGWQQSGSARQRGGSHVFAAQAVAVVGRGTDRDCHVDCSGRRTTIRGAHRQPPTHGSPVTNARVGYRISASALIPAIGKVQTYVQAPLRGTWLFASS